MYRLLILCVLAFSLSGCADPTPISVEWTYQLGDPVVHKAGVQAVVIDLDWARIYGHGQYAIDEVQAEEIYQCYLILFQTEDGFETRWVAVYELEEVSP